MYLSTYILYFFTILCTRLYTEYISILILFYIKQRSPSKIVFGIPFLCRVRLVINFFIFIVNVKVTKQKNNNIKLSDAWFILHLQIICWIA